VEGFSAFSGPDALYASSRYGESRVAWRAKVPKTNAGLRRNDYDALPGPRGLVGDSTPISNRGWTMSPESCSLHPNRLLKRCPSDLRRPYHRIRWRFPGKPAAQICEEHQDLGYDTVLSKPVQAGPKVRSSSTC
jgi:hypothetical protein